MIRLIKISRPMLINLLNILTKDRECVYTMRMVITEKEYVHFLTCGKYLPYLYRQYTLMDKSIQEIEAHRAEIEGWIEEDYVREILRSVKRKPFSKKKYLPESLYLDFIRISKYAYQLDYLIHTIKKETLEVEHGLQ